VIAFSPVAVPEAAISALIEAAETSAAWTEAASASRKLKVPPAEEVGDPGRAVHGPHREGGHRGLGLGHGLQEAAGRQGDGGAGPAMSGWRAW